MEDNERQLFQDMIDMFYERFLFLVGRNRTLERDAVHALAQGRVWSGADALEHKLVDEIGGLGSAIRFAVERAGVGDDFQVVDYPKARGFAETLAEMLEQGGRDQPLARDPVSRLTAALQREYDSLRQLNDRNSLYMRLPVDIEVR
jgi:protease-4